jgi:hypothetical protein
MGVTDMTATSEFPAPPRIPISGANSTDIARVHEQIETIFDLALSAVQARIALVRENVPITHVENFHDLDEEFKDLRALYLQRLRTMDRD